jgi:hypothetical protein
MKTKGRDQSAFIDDRRKGKELDRFGSEIVRSFIQPVVPKDDPNRPRTNLTGGPGPWEGPREWEQPKGPQRRRPERKLRTSDFRQYRSIEDIIAEEVNGR